MHQVRNIIYRGVTAKINLTLSGLPQFNGQTDESQLSGHIRIAPSLDYLERAYDAGKYGSVAPHPYLDITIPTLLDPTLAPDGQHIMSINMQYAPYHLRDNNWEDQRDQLGDAILDTLSQYAPNLHALISNRQIITPLDWEQQYSLTEGSIYTANESGSILNHAPRFRLEPLPHASGKPVPLRRGNPPWRQCHRRPWLQCGAGSNQGTEELGLTNYNIETLFG